MKALVEVLGIVLVILGLGWMYMPLAPLALGLILLAAVYQPEPKDAE